MCSANATANLSAEQERVEEGEDLYTSSAESKSMNWAKVLDNGIADFKQWWK